MALYSNSTLDFSPCLSQHGNPISAWGKPNVCVPPPSSFNPYNITSKDDFNMSMLKAIIRNENFGRNLGLCYGASDLLPPLFVQINDAISDPKKRWNVPTRSLHRLAQVAFPFPVNQSRPGDVVSWWWEQVNYETKATQDFLTSIRDDCTYAICKKIQVIGDPDITGIGMLISTGMLILLAFLFAFPSCFGWFHRTKREGALAKPEHRDRDLDGHRPRGAALRGSMVGTLDDLFSAVLLFTVSVLISSIIYRSWSNSMNESLYDVFMAEILSLISSSAMVMIAASHWQINRLRLASLLWFLVNVALTVALFAMEFAYSGRDWRSKGLPMERQCLKTILGGMNLDNLGHKSEYLPICFTLWCLALLGSLLHLPWPWMRECTRGKSSFYVVRILGLAPIVCGMAAVIWLCIMFYNTWMEMRSAFGAGYVDNQKDWGFGQFLALATWVPPILHFIQLHFDGVGKALTLRLPRPWVASIPESRERAEKRSLMATSEHGEP